MNTVIGRTVTFIAALCALPQSPSQPVRSNSAGVLLDVTVLDRRGQPVTDLKPEEFEIKEDGKSQQLTTASLVRDGVSAFLMRSDSSAIVVPKAPPAEAHVTVLEGRTWPNVTALLLDNLSADTRVMACRAAGLFIDGLQPPNEYAGIFAGGLQFKSLQSFTSNIERLRQAIRTAASSASDNISATAEEARTPQRTQGLDPTTPVTAGAEYGRSSASIGEREARLTPGGDNPSEALLTQLELRMEEGYNRFLATYAGDARLAGLRSAIDSLGALPGRKAIVYFTDELPVTDRLKPAFENLISDANRHNIVIYTVDAVGLRVQSKESETARVVNLGGAQGMGDAKRDGGAWTKDLENDSATVSSRPVATLGRLARETGGVMIDNTNDLSRGLASIQAERRSYYLLGYQPSNSISDGRFRHVSVKVKRDRVFVRTRSGYIAPAAPAK